MRGRSMSLNRETERRAKEQIERRCRLLRNSYARTIPNLVLMCSPPHSLSPVTVHVVHEANFWMYGGFLERYPLIVGSIVDKIGEREFSMKLFRGDIEYSLEFSARVSSLKHKQRIPFVMSRFSRYIHEYT